MRAALLSIDGLGPTDLARWRELARVAVEPNPFYEPELVLAACRLAPPGRVKLLVVADGADWQACLPVVRTLRWYRLPVPALVGWRHRHSYLGTPLIRPDGLEYALDALVAHALRSPTVAFLGLDQIDATGPIMTALRRRARTPGPRVSVLRHTERASLARRDDGRYVELGKKRVRELKRQRQRLGDSLRAPIETTEVRATPEMLERFLELEASGWKGRTGTALVRNPADRAFFHEMCVGFAALGRLQLLALRGGDEVVAMKCNLRAGREVYCFKIANDERWGRFSPGIQLELDNVEAFHATPGAQVMDSCADPENAMINRLWPDRRQIVIVGVSRGFRGLAASAGFRAARWVDERRKKDG